MIKICANLSKKMPLPGVDYSSQQYGAAMEIEVSDADQPEIIQQRIRELYLLLINTIDEQLSGAPQKPSRRCRRPSASKRFKRSPFSSVPRTPMGTAATASPPFRATGTETASASTPPKPSAAPFTRSASPRASTWPAFWRISMSPIRRTCTSRTPAASSTNSKTATARRRSSQPKTQLHSPKRRGLSQGSRRFFI